MAVALIWTPQLPLQARTRKGDKLLKQAKEAEARKEWDQALEFYQQALGTDPGDPAYILGVNRVRFQAGQMHVNRGQRLREAGKLEDALSEFQKAYAIDPSSTIANSEMKRTYRMIEREKNNGNGAEARPEDRGLTPSQQARQEAELRASEMRSVPALKPQNEELSRLQIINQKPKVIFETIGKLAGINVLFDPEMQLDTKQYSLDLMNTSLEDALDYAALITKWFWKPISGNAIFVTQDNATKRRDYEEQVTRVFYLQNVTSPQELQEALTAVRAVTDVRKIYPVNSQSAIVVRGTADQVALCEKLFLDLDKPKPEVVVDILVMEANKTRSRQLGLTPVSGSTNGLQIPLTFTPGGQTSSGGTDSGTGSAAAASGSSTVLLKNLAKLGSGDWSTTLPGATLNALMSDGTTRILQSPQVRATDGQKATVKLGEKYPYATGSFQPGVGTVGVSPLVSTQFQFADVGVNVDMTPRIHGSDEVSLQVELNISTIGNSIDVGGLKQPIIGQRVVQHIIRVKEGEATLIGGLMQSNEQRNRSGVPGLANVPGLKWLFSGNTLDRTDNDLLVVLIPHIVRYPDLERDNLRGVASGSDAIVKVSYAQRVKAAAQRMIQEKKGSGAAPAAEQPAIPMNPQTPMPPSEPAAARSPEANTPPPPPGNNDTANANPQPGQPAGETKLTLTPSTSEAQLNGLVTVNVMIQDAKDLFSAPMKLSYDNKVLELLQVRNGGFMARDGQQVIFEPAINGAQGSAIISLNRVPGAGGVSGSGTLVAFLFKAIGKGDSPVNFTEVTLRDAKLQQVQVSPAPVTIRVQ